MSEPRWDRICHDCGAKPNEFHERGCDVERCPFCGGQLISCGCCYKHFYPDTYHQYRFRAGDQETPFNGLPEDVYENGLRDEQAVQWEALLEDAGRLPWAGMWPGEAECREFGWYVRWEEGKGWVQCEEDHPDAGPDLNKLARIGVWDAKARRFNKPPEPFSTPETDAHLIVIFTHRLDSPTGDGN